MLTLSSGLVLAFGSNSYGQLGMGDLVPRGAPVPLHGLGRFIFNRSLVSFFSVGYCVHMDMRIFGQDIVYAQFTCLAVDFFRANLDPDLCRNLWVNLISIIQTWYS